MASATKDDLFKKAVAAKTFNSSEGRDIEKSAGKALRDIPKSLDPELLRKTYLRFAKESPQNLWFAVKRTKREHFAVISTALKELAKSEKDGFQARFLLAAMTGKSEDERFEQFSRAAELVTIASTIDGAGRVGSVPATEKDAKPVRPFADDKHIVAAARSVLPALNDEQSAVYTQGLFWNLAAVLAMAADKDSIAVLEVLSDMFLEGEDRDLKQLQYALGVSSKPAAAKVAHRIETELLAREEISGVGQWVARVGVPVPKGKYWQIVVVVQTGAKYVFNAKPELGLKMEALTPPTWKITVSTEDGATVFDGDGDRRNDLKLKRHAKSPLDLKMVLEESAEKLKVQWNLRAPKIIMSGVGEGKPLIKKWLAGL